MYCDDLVCLCACVCLSAIIFSELCVRSIPNFFCMLSMAMSMSSSGDVVICYILPFLDDVIFAHSDKLRLFDDAARLR